MAIAGFGEKVRQLLVIRQQEKSLAVSVEPAGGVDIVWEWPELLERSMPAGISELRKDSKGLIYDKGA
jgi:hypothetical protein